jgi:hypothetical protein
VGKANHPANTPPVACPPLPSLRAKRSNPELKQRLDCFVASAPRNDGSSIFDGRGAKSAFAHHDHPGKLARPAKTELAARRHHPA